MEDQFTAAAALEATHTDSRVESSMVRLARALTAPLQLEVRQLDSGSQSHQWQFVPTENSAVRIRNVLSGFCLELVDITMAIRLAVCGSASSSSMPGGLNQLWQPPVPGVLGQIFNRRRLYCALTLLEGGKVTGDFASGGADVDQMWRWDPALGVVEHGAQGSGRVLAGMDHGGRVEIVSQSRD